MTNKTKWSAQVFIVLLCALGLKAYYSSASPENLRWILGPVTWLTALLSGRSFNFETHSGYMSSDHTFLIAASCAGVNFLVTSFLMLTLNSLWKKKTAGVSWRFIPIAALTAYLATIVANTIRICIALELQQNPPQIGWLTGNQIHRIEGIVVYFGFLLLLFVLVGATEQDRTGWLKRSIFPLVIYYTTTLAMPFANGAYRHGLGFWEHSAFVLLLPLVVMMPFVLWTLGLKFGASVVGRLAPVTAMPCSDSLRRRPMFPLDNLSEPFR
jgi:exosortase K